MIKMLSYPRTLLVLRGALGLSLVWLLLVGDWRAVLVVGVFLVLSFTYLLRSEPRPNAFDVLFALAALLGALGYVFDLFSEIVPYDELTHAFTTFAVSLAFYFLFYGGAEPRQSAVALGTSVFTLGVTVGAYWEIFEWLTGARFGLADTISDLIVDSVGALVAAFVALMLRQRGQRLT